MRTVIKTIITTVLLPTLLAMVGNVEARLKYYRYNDNIPMVEMSLNMMVAMGVLEPIPSRLVHDGNPYHRMVNASYSPYSRNTYSYPERSRRYNNYRYNDYLDGPIDPYDSYYGGFDDRYYGSRYNYSRDYPDYRTWGNQWESPWANRRGNQWDGPWSNTWNSGGGSPWDYQRGNPWGSTWGNQWDNPWNSSLGSPWGNQWNSPWNSSRGSPWGNQWNSPWNSSRGSPWGNQWSNPWNSSLGSPWGSSWNNPWMNPWSSQLGYPGAWPYTPGYSTLPLSPDAILGNDGLQNNSYQSDDASQQYRSKDGYKAEKTSWSVHPSSASYRRSGYRNGNKRPYRKLNGLWIGENGEMLGIRGNRFLWYDDNNQYAKGQLLKSPTMMKARIEGADTGVSYHYKLHGNELVIMSRGGKMKTFNRMPLIELPTAPAKPRVAYSSYHPESDNYLVSYSNFGSGLKANKRSLNSRSKSDRVGPALDTGRRTHSMAPRDNYAHQGSTTQRLHVSYGGKQQQITPIKSADVYSAAPASTIPLYKQYQPAAGKPIAGSGADSVVQPAKEINVESSTWTNYAGLDMNDPNTYLYSYLKDNDSKRTSASASTDLDNSDSSAVTGMNDSANIWKPNNLYPGHRSYNGNSQSNNAAQNTGWAQSEMIADYAMRKFTWPKSGSWD